MEILAFKMTAITLGKSCDNDVFPNDLPFAVSRQQQDDARDEYGALEFIETELDKQQHQSVTLEFILCGKY